MTTITTVQEFSHLDPVTAVIHLSMDGAEAVSGPIVVGHYHQSNEVWIEQEGKRINIPAEHLSSLIKQLKRVGSIAAQEA